MYFKSDKPRPSGVILDGVKLQKKTLKSLEQLKRHDPDVKVAMEPTKYLFVANSSILCGVSLEELEAVFVRFDPAAEFVVFPNRRAYSFVEFSSEASAKTAKEALNGRIPAELKKSHLPFVIAFVENLPAAKTSLSAIRGPQNLRVIEEFVSEAEEAQLVELVEDDPRLASMKHRSVVHYGHIFDYSSNSAFTPTSSIPLLLEEIIDRSIQRGFISERPDQITANVYLAGQGIPSHFDTHSSFEETILSLSLCSDVVMEFKDAANAAKIAGVLLPQRSLAVMQGDSRYRWKHGIVNRYNDISPLNNRVLTRKKRISLTLRKIRREPCRCPYKEFCDWDRDVAESREEARALESAYVADVYEKIAAHFDETRHSNWRAVQKFLDGLPTGSLVYDIGSGNGKYLLGQDGLVKIGCDRCFGLCSIAANKGCNVTVGDALGIPLRPGIADAVLSIAVLHHMATTERRIQLLTEITRMLRVGGRACVTVWSLEQGESEYASMRENKAKERDADRERGRGEEEREMRPQVEGGEGPPRLLVHDGKEFEQQDLLVPWTTPDKKNGQQEETLLRFYHVFAAGELESLVSQMGNCVVDKCVKEQGNWIVFFTKIA